jgi:ABC-type Fe3+-hydroxamate transport system substrate-binding protein
MRQFTDMIGTKMQLESVPQRIVSLVPSQTELLYDLGLKDEVVGITKFCIHPQEWFRQKVRVGGTKQVNIEKLAALKPDLVIANKEENTKEDIEAIRKLAPVWTSDIKDLADCLSMVAQIGALCGKEQDAQDIIQQLQLDFAQLPLKNVIGKSAAYLIWNEPLMVVARHTFVHAVLESLGFTNVFATQARYPEIGLKQLAEANPEYVLLSSEPYPFKEKHIKKFKDLLPNSTILLVDGEMFSWYGSRLKHALSYFNSIFGNNMS